MRMKAILSIISQFAWNGMFRLGGGEDPNEPVYLYIVQISPRYLQTPSMKIDEVVYKALNTKSDRILAHPSFL